MFKVILCQKNVLLTTKDSPASASQLWIFECTSYSFIAKIITQERNTFWIKYIFSTLIGIFILVKICQITDEVSPVCFYVNSQLVLKLPRINFIERLQSEMFPSQAGASALRVHQRHCFPLRRDFQRALQRTCGMAFHVDTAPTSGNDRGAKCKAWRE